MNHYKLVSTLVLSALVVNCLRLADVASANSMNPELVPLPRKAKSATEAAISPRPEGSMQVLQENINVAIDGDHEIDTAQPPRRIDIPLSIQAVRKTDSRSNEPTIVNSTDIATFADENRAIESSQEKIKGVNSTTTTTAQSTKKSIIIQPTSKPDQSTVYPIAEEASNQNYAQKKNETTNNGTERPEVGLLLATILIVSTGLTCGLSFGKNLIVV